MAYLGHADRGFGGYRPVAAADPIVLRFGDAFKITLLHIDCALITLWFIVTAAQFQYDELLLYPLALYFTASFFVWRRATWPIFQRGFLLILPPLWWMASTLWSPEPTLAFRTGLQSFLTILICMFIASRLTTRQFLLVILAATTVLAFRSLPQSLLDFSLGKPSKAIYAHKNSLGMAMAVLFATSLAIALSGRVAAIARLFALGVAPIALFLVFASQSATAILIVVGLSGIVLGSQVFLGPQNRITPGRLLVIACAIAFASAAAMAALNFLQDDPVDLVLGALGKDRGLTGRTDLWAIGVQQMAENPFFGVGAHGFWRYGESAEVRQIFFEHYKTWKNNFYFHNSWLEIGVAFGWIGVVLAVSATAWAILTLMRRAFVTGGPENWALFAIAIAILIRTMTESDLFVAFNMLHMLLWSCALIPPQRDAAPRL